MNIALHRGEKRILALCALGGLFLAAHLGWTYFLTHSVPAPDHGGTLTEGSIGTFSGGNPIFAFPNTGDADLARLIYSGLTRYDPATERFVPDLATYERDPTRTRYTFTLREGAMWHDGKPVTADDVLFTYRDILQNPEVGAAGLLAAHENSSVEKINERTIRITLKEPYAFFSSITTFPILPKHLWGNIPAKEVINTPLSTLHVGSGPYRFEALRASQDGSSVTAVLSAFDDYYGARPWIRKLNLTTYKDAELLRSALGGLSAANAPSSIIGLEEGTSGAFRSLSYTLAQYVAVFANTSSAILDDRNVRLALLLATDKQAILKSVLDAKRIDTPTLQDKSRLWIYRTDLQRANGALHQAGWRFPTPTPSPSPEASAIAGNTPTSPTPVPSASPSAPAPTPTPSPSPTPSPTPTPTDGGAMLPPTPYPVRTSAQGDPLRLELVTATIPETYTRIAEALQKQYREVGVELRLTVLPPDQLQERVRNKSYDLLLYGQSLDYNLDTYPFWHSSQQGTNGLNLSNLTSGTVDRLLGQIRNPYGPGVTTDEQAAAKRQEATTRMEAFFDDQVPAIFLYQPLYGYHFRSTELKGMEIKNMRAFSDRFAFLEKAYQTEQHVLAKPFSLGSFLRWCLGLEHSEAPTVPAMPSVAP